MLEVLPPTSNSRSEPHPTQPLFEGVDSEGGISISPNSDVNFFRRLCNCLLPPLYPLGISKADVQFRHSEGNSGALWLWISKPAVVDESQFETAMVKYLNSSGKPNMKIGSLHEGLSKSHTTYKELTESKLSRVPHSRSHSRLSFDLVHGMNFAIGSNMCLMPSGEWHVYMEKKPAGKAE